MCPIVIIMNFAVFRKRIFFYFFFKLLFAYKVIFATMLFSCSRFSCCEAYTELEKIWKF